MAAPAIWIGWIRNCGPRNNNTIMKDQDNKPVPGRRRKKEFRCHCCKNEKPFCWNCGCGFQICPECFAENKWGMSNGPTWICPDCERVHMME
jgi:membrane protease subunit (stomatin/prohibitin family)